MESGPAQRLVTQALAGKEPALESLVDLLTPVVQARVARVLLVHRPPGGDRSIRQQVEDLAQEVFLALFADDARVLKSWEPDRGLSLENFVGLVARRRAISILRTDKRNPWTEDPTRDEKLDGSAPGPNPEARAASREQLGLLLRRLQEELSPLGWHLFDLLYIRDLPVEKVCAEAGMSRDAVYAWRSRLRKLAHRLLEKTCQKTDENRE